MTRANARRARRDSARAEFESLKQELDATTIPAQLSQPAPSMARSPVTAAG